jgi:hypothetical protein
MSSLRRAFARGPGAPARLAMRSAAVAAILLAVTGCAANRLDRQVYVATTTDTCAALGATSTPVTPPLVEIYRVTVVGRKHAIDNTQLAGGWMPAAAVDLLLKAERPDDAQPGVINAATQPAQSNHPEPVLSLDPAGAVQHVAKGSRLVLLFGPDAQATLDEWMAAGANGRFVDPKVQAEGERTRMRTDRCWLDAIRTSLIGPSAVPAAATVTADASTASSEGLK